jgi:ATP-dependent helicase HrpA
LKRQIIDLTFERACLSEPLPTTPEAFKSRCGEARRGSG